MAELGILLIAGFVSFAMVVGAAAMLQFMRQPPGAAYPMLILGLVAGTVSVGLVLAQIETPPRSSDPRTLLP